MGHIHTKPGQHDQTASAFIIRTDFNEPKLLLHRHRLLGKYLQLGGHVELNETPWQAIVRELKEESGYSVGQLKLLQPKIYLDHLSGAKLHPMPMSLDTHNFSREPDHFHTDMKFAFLTSEEPKESIDSDESSDIRLFSRDEVSRLSDDDTFADIKHIANYIYDHLLKDWQAVDPGKFEL
ncbi:MAG TPA: NUDIX domain-containing protein [Candidatus Saccharimonadales bacterium]|jgi:8-oxo-dGTP pyrophosphatase MutT (NUDIX family)